MAQNNDYFLAYGRMFCAKAIPSIEIFWVACSISAFPQAVSVAPVVITSLTINTCL